MAPYRLRACLRFLTPCVSSDPRMILYRTPGRSFTRPPRTSTIECSCRLWPTPGMYAVTSMPLVRRTRATLRSAELGFLGVVVYTRVHTPRRWGLPLSAGVLVLPTLSSRPLRTSCWIVGTASPCSVCGAASSCRVVLAGRARGSCSRVVLAGPARGAGATLARGTARAHPRHEERGYRGVWWSVKTGWGVPLRGDRAPSSDH